MRSAMFIEIPRRVSQALSGGPQVQPSPRPEGPVVQAFTGKQIPGGAPRAAAAETLPTFPEDS